MSILDLHTGSVVLREWIDTERHEVDGELDPVIDQLLQDLEGDISQKVENYCKFIRELELTAEARKAEGTRIMALVKTDLNLAQRLRDRLLYFMGLQGVNKLETKTFKIGVINNGGPVPLRVDTMQLEEQYWQTVKSPDMQEIRKVIESGAEVKGVAICTRGQHLRIK